MKSILLLCTFFSTLPIWCTAQYLQKIDSLKAVFEKQSSYTSKLFTCKELIPLLIHEDDSAATESYIQQGIALANKLLDKETELYLKSQRARLLLAKKDYQSAQELCAQILTQSKEDGLQLVSVNCYHILGRSHTFQSNDSMSILFYSKAIKIYEELGDLQGMLLNYDYIGMAYVRRDDYVNAIHYFEKIVKINKQFGDQKEVAANYNNIGLCHKAQGNYDEALRFFEKGRAISERLNDKSGMAQVYTNTGNIYHKKGNYAKAIIFQQKAIAIREELKDTKRLASNYNNLGINYQAQGNDSAAIHFYEKTLNIFKQLGHEDGMTYVYVNIGEIHAKNGHHTKALAFHQKALQIRDKLNIKRDYHKLLYIVGYDYLNLGKEDAAFYYFDQSFALLKTLHLTKKLREYFVNLGEWYTKRAQLPKALTFYYDALQLAEDSKDTLGISSVYNGIAHVYKMQRNYTKSLDYQQKALNSLQQLNAQSQIAHTNIGIANTLIEMKDYKQALSYNFKAFKSYQVLKDSCQFGNCLLAIGRVYSSLQKEDSALYRLKQAIPVAKDCGKNDILAAVYIEMGNVYQLKQQLSKAFQVYEQALAYADKSQNREVLKKAAEYLYPIYKKQGKLKKALATFEIFHANSDSLFNEANTRKLVQKEMEYAYARKEQEAALLQQQKNAEQQRQLEQQQWIIFTSIGGLVAMLVIALAMYRNYRNKQKANLILTEQKAELKKLDEVKSRLFANISHELRTPLTLISGPIEQLLSNTKADQIETLEKLQMVKRNNQQLKGLVDDILDLSKLESSKIEVYERKVAILPFVRRVFANYTSLAKNLGIQYDIQLDGLSDDWLLLDAGKTEKILNNLLSNAIKHTPAGKTVTLSAQQQGDKLIFQVKDTGQGIAIADLPHIFDRFFQSKQTDTPIQGGTGIGLALAKELVQLLEGKIDVQSQLGEGSLFSVELPYQVTIPDEPLEIPIHDDAEHISLEHLVLTNIPKNPNKYTVLVVEDHPDMQQFVFGLLKSRYRVLLANNGKKALNLLAKEKVDLVVSDVMMPEMDGYTLLEHLKKSDDFRHIPVIILTALDSDDHKLQALILGVDDYLTKPFSSEELLARSYNLLERYAARQLTQQEPELQLLENTRSKPSTVIQNVAVAESRVKESDTEWLTRVAKTMRKELENPQYHIADLAEQFHLSERHFYRKIKQLTGMPPKKYQQEVALQEARNLLEKGSYDNVTAICYSVGMSNVSRFSKLYEARFGRHPNTYFSN